jgi:tRNA-Thr(GGU) m(6)t(6)A37 methyltransferase TsaA
MSNQNGNSETYTVKPIGTIHADKGEFYVEVFEPYRPALKLLDEWSHVMVLWWADQVDTDEARSITEAELPYAPGTIAGIFATRSPARPNPLTVTNAAMLGIDEEAGIIRLAYIDAEDGTPLVDIKPYVPMSDRIRDAKYASWFEGFPEYYEDAAEFFATHEVDFGD